MIQCRICGEEFIEKWNLMKHRKESHITAVGPCRKLVDGNCNFTSESCWWNHAENISENVQCFICNKTFDNKTDMMGHRKKNHSSIIQKCSRILLVYSQL